MNEPASRPVDAFGARPVSNRTHRYTGYKWELVTETVQLPAGEEVQRDVVVHPGAVGVLALDERDRVVLIQQYRHPAAGTLWELPAGLLDDDSEDPWATAQRELYEEAHLRASQWHVLVDLLSSPGMSSECVRVYLARGLSDVPQADRHVQTEEERDMPSMRIDLAAACQAVLSGQIHNAMAVAGLLAAKASREQQWGSLRPPDSEWLNDQSAKGI